MGRHAKSLWSYAAHRTKLVAEKAEVFLAGLTKRAVIPEHYVEQTWSFYGRVSENAEATVKTCRWVLIKRVFCKARGADRLWSVGEEILTPEEVLGHRSVPATFAFIPEHPVEKSRSSTERVIEILPKIGAI